MSHSLGIVIESLVAILLMVTIGYCRLLNTRLKRSPSLLPPMSRRPRQLPLRLRRFPTAEGLAASQHEILP